MSCTYSKNCINHPDCPSDKGDGKGDDGTGDYTCYNAKWPSDICVCTHYMSQHYRKNYKYRGSSSRDSGIHWGNVDYRGCDGENCTCKNFQHVQTSFEVWSFEHGFMWDVKDPELRKIYQEEIKGPKKDEVIMNSYQWITRNVERYVELLKARGANFDREVTT